LSACQVGTLVTPVGEPITLSKCTFEGDIVWGPNITLSDVQIECTGYKVLRSDEGRLVLQIKDARVLRQNSPPKNTL